VLKELALEEELRKLQSEQQLSEAERAFLPTRVRNELLELGTVPVTPKAITTRGAVLFVDISGFTILGKKLRNAFPPLEAASKLAQRINNILRELTKRCQLYEGDVAKFAGDALLCVWDMSDESKALELAKGCAVSMLRMMKSIDENLDLHGGIATGSLMHFHLGDKRHELRWYLLTGGAVGAATTLVEQALRGTIHVKEGDRNDVLTVNSKTKIAMVGQDSSTSLRAGDSADGGTGSGDVDDAPAAVSRPRVNTIDDPFLNLKITYKGRAYIPKLLRNVLAGGRLETGGAEMRNRVAILFATLPELTMTEEELANNVVSPDRQRLLNDSFVDMVNIVRALDGEVRDLLFDDKGCVFIAVFGAYGVVEMPELKAAKAARRMFLELECEVKVGVSVGTCFVGLAGDDRRHDYVVMGHEVNMAARYMGKAQDVLVGERIHEMTKEFFGFERLSIELKKDVPAAGLGSQRSLKNTADLSGEGEAEVEARRSSNNSSTLAAAAADPNGIVVAWRPTRDITRRPSFMATYRYAQILNDKFTGRKAQLSKVESHLAKALKEKTACTLSVTGPRGYGKTALILQVRRMMDERFVSALGTAFELESETPFYVIRQVIESLFGLFEDMPPSKGKGIVEGWAAKEKIAFEYEQLERILPYISKLVPPPKERPRPIKVNRGIRAGSVVNRLLTAGTKLSMRNLDDVFPGEEAPAVAANAPVGADDDSGGGDRQATSNSSSKEREAGSARAFAMPRSSSRRSEAALDLSASSAPPATAASTAAAQEASPHVSKRGFIASMRLLRTPSALNLMGSSSAAATPSAAAPAAAAASAAASAAAAAAASATAAGEAADDPDTKRKKERIARKKSRGAANFNVLGVKQLEGMAALLLSLLTLAAKQAYAAGKKGLLVVFEDSQWLDTSSLQVLEVVMERMRDDAKLLPSTCLLMSGRTNVSSEDSSTAATMPGGQKDMRKLLEVRVLETLEATKPHLAVEMDELSRAEVDAIVSSLLERGQGDSVSKEILDAMFRNSGGMPNAIADVMELINSNGGSIHLDPKSNQWRWKPNSNNGESVLHAARAAFVARIDSLSVETKDILKIAAITCDAKQKFRLHDLVRVIEADLATKSRYVKASHGSAVSEPRLAFHLQPAVSIGLVKYSRGFVSSTEDWAFASSAIAEAALEMVPLERQLEIEAIAQNLDISHKKNDVQGLSKEIFGL